MEEAIHAAPLAFSAMKMGASHYNQVFHDSTSFIHRVVNTKRLQFYFAVSNQQILRKIGVLLFPYTHSSWKRQTHASEASIPLTPAEDINTPDLYLPFVGIVTYIIFCAMGYAVDASYDMQHISRPVVCSIAVVAVELIGFKLASIAFGIAGPPLLEIVGIFGYKYVSLCVALLLSLIHPIAYYMALAYVAAAFGVFIMRTLNPLLISQTEQRRAGMLSDPMVDQADRKALMARTYFVFIVGISQVAPLILLGMFRPAFFLLAPSEVTM
ncbi:hypothetical protein J8273_3741 [Carpediemonas membranifera]|uniref:Protein YIF1 n=1 Tax=Carpediemonas membranifera TaxID=201153 RepID=A0A8J6EAJ0_9EUKA|nr:hypothetical protein J8273_3741 [Carpediemonas membranifera]|eukprot:KAG9394765.1 hypothetical protein J8273_3741 [Carpediemonas membranifera]